MTLVSEALLIKSGTLGSSTSGVVSSAEVVSSAGAEIGTVGVTVVGVLSSVPPVEGMVAVSLISSS